MAKGVPILGKDPLGKAKYANVTESGDLRVQLSGTIETLYSMDIAERPDYTTLTKPTAFVLLNEDLDTWVSDGTNDWVEV